MSLTAHFFAGDTDKLFTNANGGGIGVHTGTPSNGSAVNVWQDEATPATRDVILYRSGPTTAPTFASPGTMLLPSLTFDGSDDGIASYGNNTMVPKAMSSLLGAGAKTVLMAFRMTAAATNNANVYQNSTLICDEGAYFGLHLKSNGGTHELFAYNYDGNIDVTTSIAISLNTDYVVLFRHDGTNINLSLLSGTAGGTRVDRTMASGATQVTTSILRVGRSYQTHCYTGAVGEVYLDNSDLGSSPSILTDIVGRWLPAAAPQAGNMMFLF